MRSGETVVGYALRGQGRGLEAQRAAIAAECQRRGWRLAGVEIDRIVAAGAGRPGRARALAACGSGQARALVVARLDCLARSLSEAGRLLERAQGEGWTLVALDLGLDTSRPAGARIANAFALAADWERQLNSERTRAALARRRAQGGSLGTPRKTAPSTVTKIRALHARGLSLQAIADELNRLRIPTTRGAASWRHSSVRSVLTRAAG